VSMDVVARVFVLLKFGVCRSLRPLIATLVPGQQRSLNHLKQMRKMLADELADVVNTFGPRYYEGFDDVSTILFARYMY
jgi:glycerol-3-phosphate O-acyltransferase/dihydroxyacetone phosphate acyltransferase